MNLSKCYRLGKGTPVDLDESEKWCLKAIEMGHSEGKKQLEIISQEKKNKQVFHKLKK
jgi:TPR repeat protein